MQSSAQSNIVINEFEANPTEKDYGNEWLELYNPTNTSIDVSNWQVKTIHGDKVNITIEKNVIIDPKSYYIVGYDKQWLDNHNESIILQDSLGNEIDRTPVMSDNENNSLTWSRYPNGIDTNTENDWKFQQSTKEDTNGGEEPSPTPPPATESPPPATTTTETTTSSDEQPIPVASAQQTANYLPYITIPLATLAAIIVASVYIVRIRPSKIQQNRHQQLIHEYELALEALDHMDVAAARRHVMAAKQIREGKI
jgi:hypothetical protein